MRGKDVDVCSVHLIGALGTGNNKWHANIHAHILILLSSNISDELQKLFVLLFKFTANATKMIIHYIL
jgi:hypothetical protein